jgi:hypothetical protein
LQVQLEVVQRTMRDLRVGSPQTIARMEENARRTGGASTTCCNILQHGWQRVRAGLEARNAP